MHSGQPIGADARRSARRGWAVVAGAFVIMFASFGACYSFSAFFASLQQTFGASRGALSWVLSIAVSTIFVVGAASGPLADRIGPRVLAAAGGCIVAAGLFVAAASPTLVGVYLGFGLGIGLGTGISYVPAVGAVQRWFVRRRGFASGLAVTGIGAGTLVMPKLAEWLIDGAGWRTAYVVFGCFAVVAGGVAALLIDGSPLRHGFLPDGGVAAPGTTVLPKPAGMAFGAAMRSRPFGMLYGAALFISLGLFMPFVHLTPFAEDRGIPHSVAVTLFALLGVGSTFGRFLVGGVADRFGRKLSLAGMYLGIGVMLAWWLASANVWQICVFALVFGTCYGGFVALSPALIVDYFGERNASGLIGVSYTAVALGTLVGSPLAGYAFDFTHSYTLPIGAGAAMTLVGALLIALAPDPAAFRRETQQIDRGSADLRSPMR